MIIRREKPADRSTIKGIHAAAFAEHYTEPGSAPVEPRLVEELWADGDALPALCLVALDGTQAVGHVMCSRAVLEPSGIRGIGLGPIGVRPDLQAAGTGSALMHAAIAAADASDEPLIGVLGEPAYYQRFGFVIPTDQGVGPPDPDWGVHFQVRPLTSWSRPNNAQVFRYAAAFDRL